MALFEFYINIISLPLGALLPFCRLSLQQKLVPEIYPRGKGSRCAGLTNLTHSCADFVEICVLLIFGIVTAYISP